MSTTTPDLGYNFLTVVDEHADMGTDPHETAVYKHDPTTGDWTLIANENGDAQGIRAALTSVGGVAFRKTSRITHLRRGGEWMQVVPDHLMQPTTARQKIETEIANLRDHARRISLAAGYSGSHGSGANILEARADAMQHVLDVLDTDDDN